jgi:hypothetical protein
MNTVVFCGCGGALPITIWVQHRLRVLMNWMLRRILGPKREDVTRGWRNSYSEGLKTVPLIGFRGPGSMEFRGPLLKKNW